MSKFGWSYPPGCSGTPYDEEYPCAVCGYGCDADCPCPPCPVCDESGNPECYDCEGHGMQGPPQWECPPDPEPYILPDFVMHYGIEGAEDLMDELGIV